MSEKVPKGWKRVKLGEVVIFNYGKSLPEKKRIKGNIPVYSSAGITGWHNEALVQSKGIIVGRKGTIGKVYKSKVPFYPIDTCYYILPSKNYDFDFMYYLLIYLKLEELNEDSAVPGLNRNTAYSQEILLPPLPEQKAIASVLSSLDDKIDLLHRQNQTLEQMAETLFRKWFVEEAKEEWERKPLEDFLDFKEGPGIRNWQYKEEGIPFINIRLISNGEIDLSKANYVSEEEAYGKYSHFLLKRKDMVISTSGTLGKSAIIRTYHLPLLLNTSVIRFRPKDGVNYSFMYCYLKSDEFYESLVTSASGSVQLNFGPTHLKQIEMIIPPTDLLEKFRKIADPIYEKIEFNYSQIRTLENLRDTLLPKLMSGEVRVKI